MQKKKTDHTRREGKHEKITMKKMQKKKTGHTRRRVTKGRSDELQKQKTDHARRRGAKG